MKQHLLMVVLLAVQVGIVVCIAPLLMGWMKQIKCWLQNRTAQPILQPYYSIYKLFIKQPVLAKNASWLFCFAPYIYFTLLIAASCALPFIMMQTLAYQFIDVIVLTGLFAFSRIILALAAMDVGTAFGSLGARREIFIACLAEPVLLIVFLNITILTHSPYLTQMSHYFINYPQFSPSVLFSLIALILVLMAETGRIPIDNPATHLELTMIHEAMVLEYSGRYLALIEWGNAIKFTIYLGLVICLFIPFGLSSHFEFFSIIFSLFCTLIKLFFLTALIALIESINSKMRLFKIPDYLAGAFMLAILGVLITILLRSSS